MDIYFNEKDQLYFDGYDIGKSVEEAWGDADYEYTYTIEPTEVNKFYELFNLIKDDKSGLLQALKDRFSSNRAFTLFGDFMKAHDIKFSTFTWA